jgi:hypothetical protein
MGVIQHHIGQCKVGTADFSQNNRSRAISARAVAARTLSARRR